MSLATSIKPHRVLMPSAFVAAAILIWLLWPAPKEAPAAPLPSPNGYDDFVKAGQLLDTAWADYTMMTKEELGSFISTNREALRLARIGLTRECRVPTPHSMDDIQKHLALLGGIKHLAQVLSAEGRLAEAQEKFEEAAKIHVEVMHLGQASSRGGSMIDKLVGVAIEDIGLGRLERVAPSLNVLACQKTIQAVEEMDAHSDSAAEYIKRSWQWNKKAYGMSGWIREAWAYKSLFPHREPDQKFTAKFLRTDRRRRQLLLNLAARTFELEHGKRPLRAEDLVPSVLRAIPKDPETGTNLILSPSP